MVINFRNGIDMIKVADVDVAYYDDAGCNNGRYQPVTIRLSNGEKVYGITCRCGRGCSNTDRLPQIGMEFESINALNDYMTN